MWVFANVCYTMFTHGTRYRNRRKRNRNKNNHGSFTFTTMHVFMAFIWQTTEIRSQPNCDHLRYSAIAWQHRHVWFERSNLLYVAAFALKFISNFSTAHSTFRFEFGSLFACVLHFRCFRILFFFSFYITACCGSNGHFTLFFILIWFFRPKKMKQQINTNKKSPLSVLYGEKMWMAARITRQQKEKKKTERIL